MLIFYDEVNLGFQICHMHKLTLYLNMIFKNYDYVQLEYL
jgi:hypothetical protein